MAASNDARHDCPAPGCTQRVPFERFACRRHWWSLPVELRADLWRHWLLEPGTEAYFATRAECLRALGVPEHEIPELNAGVAVGP